MQKNKSVDPIKKKRKIVPIICFICIMLALFASFSANIYMYKKLQIEAPIDAGNEAEFWDWVATEYMKIDKGEIIGEDIPTRLFTKKYGILYSILAYQANQITDGLETEQEKAIAISEWVSSHITSILYDYNQEKPFFEENVLGYFANRRGLCGARAQIAAHMMRISGIRVRNVSLYDFPFPSDGHACLEAYYDGKWHFYDPTYAGYFMKDNDVLSIEEVVNNPSMALENMIIFPNTIDFEQDGDTMEEWTNTDNFQRMPIIYNLESLTNLKGSIGYNEEAIMNDNYSIKEKSSLVRPNINMVSLPLQMGEDNSDDVDLISPFKGEKFTVYLNYALGKPRDPANMQTEWNFTNCTVGDTYLIEYHVYNGLSTKKPFRAVATDAEIIEGQTYEINKIIKDGEIDIWSIVFKPTASECKIRIVSEVEDTASGANIDSITIKQLDQ